MIVAFDNTFLSIAFNPKTKPRSNPATGAPVDNYALKVDALIDELGSRGATIIVPTPCLAEMLCVVPDFEKVIGEIYNSPAIELAPFDTRCAIELALVNRRALEAGDKRSGVPATWNEVKFDRQIAAVAKVARASILYTDDVNQATFAKQIGLEVKHTWDLDLPDKYSQYDFLDDIDNQK